MILRIIWSNALVISLWGMGMVGRWPLGVPRDLISALNVPDLRNSPSIHKLGCRLFF